MDHTNCSEMRRNWLRVVFATLLLSLLCSIPCVMGDEIGNNVTIIFNGAGKVLLPPGRAAFACDSTTILSSDVLKVLEDYHSPRISRQFDEADSIVQFTEGRDGVMVAEPNLYGFYTLEFQDESEAESAAEQLMLSEDVAFAVQERLPKAFVVSPNDTLYAKYQWSLNNTLQFGGITNSDINAPEAWAYDTGSVNVKIGIIDGGVWSSHNDLSGKVTGDPPRGNQDYDPYH